MRQGLGRCNSRKKRSKKRTVLREHGPWCYWCGGALVYQLTTLDHVIPDHYGGPNANTNLVPSCYDCNQAKGSQAWKETYRPILWSMWYSPEKKRFLSRSINPLKVD